MRPLLARPWLREMRWLLLYRGLGYRFGLAGALVWLDPNSMFPSGPENPGSAAELLGAAGAHSPAFHSRCEMPTNQPVRSTMGQLQPRSCSTTTQQLPLTRECRTPSPCRPPPLRYRGKNMPLEALENAERPIGNSTATEATNLETLNLRHGYEERVTVSCESPRSARR